jgi:nucleotide-binding universal stress UspA family protein
LFEKILVPVDGSDHSQRALETAIEVASKFRGNLTLIHVYQVPVRPVVIPEPTTLTPPPVTVIAPAEVAKVAEAAREAAMKILKDGEERAKAAGLDVEIMLKEGNASQEILKIVKEGDFGLIVMGARGISKLKEILVGSVSDDVIRNASCPVLIVK